MNIKNPRFMAAKKERIALTHEALHNHPDKREEILDLYDLMEDEIDSGESPDAEFEKFQHSLTELLHE